jgi:hypothetical protein
LKSSCHSIRVLIYLRIFISFCKWFYLFKF